MKFIFEMLPKTLEELKNAAPLTSPHATSALFILAICEYTKNPENGIAMINYLRGPQPLSNYEKQFLRDRLADKPYLPYSYFTGSAPENDYTPNRPYEIETFDDVYPPPEGYSKLFLQSHGADSRRPIVLRKKGEEFFLWEFNSLLSGIRIPRKDDIWA